MSFNKTDFSALKVGDELLFRSKGGRCWQKRTVAKIHKKYFVDDMNATWSDSFSQRGRRSLCYTGYIERWGPEADAYVANWKHEQKVDILRREVRLEFDDFVRRCHDVDLLDKFLYWIRSEISIRDEAEKIILERKGK